MQSLICLLLLLDASYVRAANKTVAPVVESRQVWVFFSDKGIYDESQYQAAVAALSRPRHETRDLVSPRTPDFNDIPVRQTYLSVIENMGGRLRSVSNWLNAASFDLAPELVPGVYALPFVYDLRPVASRAATGSDFFPLTRREQPERYRAVDTAYAHRFYGPSYDQAQMMGVPDLFFRGYFGAKVKLAMFDTGIKLKNRGIARVRIHKQHDFISGDNAYSAGSETAWQPSATNQVRYLGFARGLTLNAVPTRSGSSDTLLLTFCADSFSYGYNPSRRAVFACASTDAGRSWTAPSALVMSAPYSVTFENLVMVGRAGVSYLAYNDLAAQQRGPALSNVYLGYFTGVNWHSVPRLLGSGRYPAACVLDDTLYVALVRYDTLVMLWKASVAQPEPSYLLGATFAAGEVLAGVQVCADSDGVVDVFTTGLKTGCVRQFRSVDAGANFSELGQLVGAGAAKTRVLTNGGQRLLTYEDQSATPFSRLSALRSTDHGQTWHPGAVAADSVFSIGSYAVLDDKAGKLTLVYETGGMLYRSSSADFGATWSSAGLMDTTGFNASPVLARAGVGLLALWLKRGDEMAVWEASDTARFSIEQSDHGTRMASIIAGYQQGAVVGIAPGVDLLVAKTELYKTRSGRFYEYNMEEDAYIEALEWADRMGADIVSTSLGYRSWYGDKHFDGKTAPISIAASIAARRGLLVVTAMGNRDTSEYPWPKAYIVAPGDADGVVTAGGVQRNLLPWLGTGTGPTSDGRVKPDLVALSDTVAVVSPDSEDYLDGSGGTSCATALIAGACALLKEAHPQWSADSIKAVLFATATRSVKSCTFGFGVPRVDSAFKLFPPDKGISEVKGDEIGAVFPNPFLAGQQSRVYFPINLVRPAPFDSAVTTPLESPVVIRIFTAAGSLVDTVRLDTRTMGRPGRYGAQGDIATLETIGAWWDGKNAAGKPGAPGLYVAVLKTTFGHGAAKFALVR